MYRFYHEGVTGMMMLPDLATLTGRTVPSDPAAFLRRVENDMRPGAERVIRGVFEAGARAAREHSETPIEELPFPPKKSE